MYFYFSYCILQLWLVLFYIFLLFVKILSVFIYSFPRFSYILIALSSLSGKLFLSVSLGFFSIFSFLVLPLNIFLCLLILFNFLCLYEFRWNNYLSWSWRHVLVWEHPYEVCTCPVALVGELDLRWAQATSSCGVCWQPPPWWVVGLELEGLEPDPGVIWDVSYAHWLSLPYGGQGQGLGGAGSGALREVGFSWLWWQSPPWLG